MFRYRCAKVEGFLGFIFFLLYAIIHWINYRAMLGLNEPVRNAYIYLLMIAVIVVFKTLNGIRSLLDEPKLNYLILMGNLLFLWLILIHMAWYFEFRAVGASQFFLNWSGATLIGPLLFWLVGQAIVKASSRLAKSIIWISFVLGIGIVIYGLYSQWIMQGVIGFLVWNPTTEVLYDYQSLADYLALVGLFIMSFSNQIKKRLIIYLFMLIVLFFAYSRSALFIFALSGLLYIMMSISRKDLHRVIWVILIFVVFISFLLSIIRVSNIHIEAFLGETFLERMIMFSHEPSSLKGRLELLDLGLDTLRSHWLLGEYASEWWRDGEKGRYVHNWLSFWISYGIGPFLLFGVILATSIHKSLAYYKLTRDALPMTLIVFAMSSIILSRSYIWPFIWFVLGCIAGLKGDTRTCFKGVEA